jgi:adenine phosphoribosyltransferase
MENLSQLDYASYLKGWVRTVPHWPQEGVMFRDITPLLQNPKTFRMLIDLFIHRYMGESIDFIAGLDARGFILGSVVAYELNLGFIPIRKKGKLPYETVTEEYELEYGISSIEMHTDACKPGDRVILMDDIVATGGTMIAGLNLLRRLGADIVECAAIIELANLGGADRLREQSSLFTVCQF